MDGFQLFSQLTDQKLLVLKTVNKAFQGFFQLFRKSISERISINSPLDSSPFLLSRQDGQKVLKVSPLIFSKTNLYLANTFIKRTAGPVGVCLKQCAYDI